jgi:hypothetical protein
LGGGRIKFYLPKLNKLELIQWLYDEASITGQLQSLDLTQSKEFSGFGMNFSALLSNSIPQLDLDIGYSGLAIYVEDTLLSSLDITSGIKINPSTRNIDLGLDVRLAKAEVGPKVAKLLNTIRGSDSSSARFGGFTFGESPNSKLITFSKIMIQFTAAELKSALEKVQLGPLPFDQIKSTIQSMDLSVTGKELGLRSIIQLENTSRFGIQTGTLSLNVLVKGKPIRIQVGEIRAPRGSSQMEWIIKFGLEAADESTAVELNTLFEQTQKGEHIDQTLSVIDLRLETTDTPAASIDQFRSVEVEISTDWLLRQLQHTGVVDFSGLGFGNNMITNLGIRLTGASVQARPNRVLQSGVTFFYNNSLPISLSVPFFGVNLVMKDEFLARLEISGIRLARAGGEMQIEASLLTSHSEQASRLVSELVAAPLQVSRLNVADIRLGTRSDPINVFSKLSFDISKWLPKEFSFESLKLGSGFDFEVTNSNFGISPKSQAQALLVGSINSDITLSIDIPFFSGLTLIEEFQFATLKSRVSVSKEFEINSSIFVSESVGLQKATKKLVEEFLMNSTVSSEFGFRDLVLGESEQDAITLFSELSTSFLLPSAVQNFLKNMTAINPEHVIANIDLRTGSFKTTDDKRIEFELSGQFKKPISLSVTGLHYVQLVSGLDGIDILEMETSKLDITDTFTVGSNLRFPSGEQIRQKVGSFAESLQRNGAGNTEEEITVHGIRFGASKEDAFRFLELVKISVDSRKLITPGVVDALVRFVNVDQEIKLQNVNVDGYRIAPSLFVDVNVGFKAQLQVDVGNVYFETMIDDERFSLVYADSFMERRRSTLRNLRLS